jgi:hypothetical protein
MDDGHLNLAKNKTDIPEVELIFRPAKIEKKSCDQTSKVLGLYWNLYSTDDQRTLDQHILECSFCQHEFHELRLKQERLKKEIPDFALGLDQKQSLNAELAEIIKNTYTKSIASPELVETNFIPVWNRFLKSAPKVALGVLGLSLLTVILIIPWI